MKETFKSGLSSTSTFSSDGLSPLSSNDIPLLKEYLSSVPSWLSAYSIPALSIWQDFFSYYWTLLDDYLCLFAQYDGNYYMPLPPLGNGFSERAVRESFFLMDCLNSNPAVSRIENVDEKEVAFFRKMCLEVRLNAHEYLYRTEALASLKGGPYKSKRWAINYFIKHYQASFEPYRSADLSQCEELFKDWSSMRQTKFKDSYYRALMEDAALAHRQAMEHYKELGLVGRVVKINGQVKGYTFGFQLRAQVFCVLLEVADLRIKGLAQFLFWRFCQELEVYTYINALDDSGLANLAKVKESYNPERLLPSYAVYRG